MSRYSGLLERHKLQTYSLPPDKCMHILTTDQGVDGPTQVLYKKQAGSSGYLGGGSFGAVHLEIIDSECQSAPTVRAVKTINKRAAETSKVHWEQEVENLIVLSQYPDLFVKILGWWEDAQSIFLPMEYFEASDLARNRELIRDEGDIKAISQQLCHGLQQMHSLNIIHRDIKPHNVFVVRQRPEWHVKIGDFGFSKRVSDSVSAPFSARGTTKYMAPEYRDLMNNCESSDFTTAVDMWSFGCLIYELFAKKCPFDEDDNTALMRYVRSGSFPRQPLDDCGASSESIWLVMNLLRREPHLRLSAHDALHCAWLTTVSSPVASDPMSAPNKAHNLPTSSGLPTLFVISDDASTGNDGNSSSSAHLPARPRPEERAVSSCELPTTHLSSDDAAVPIEKLFQPPQLPARPKSSNTLRTGFLQSGEDKKPAVALIQTQTVSFPDIPVAERMNNMRPAQIARKPVPEAPIHPNLPLLKVTRLGGDYIDMAFANLKFKPQRKPTCDVCESRRVFNPVIKPAAVYYCVECGNRPLCARCIAETIRSPADVHEADHKLQAWIQAHSFPLQEFLDRFQPIHVVLESGVDPSYGKSWLSSDYSFTPPAEGSSGTRWVFNAPAGDFDLSVQLRIIQQEQMVDGSAIGKHKAMMIHARAVHLGSILFGARVIDSDQATDTKSDRHLPDGAMEKSIRSAKEEQKITLKLGFKLKAGANQKIEVHIRGAYDELYFKAGSPFRWCLEQISLMQMGAEQHVASLGDLKMREDIKQRQAKAKRDKRIQSGMQYLGQGLGIVAKVNGVRSASPSKQTSTLLSAVSMGLSAGGSMFGGRNHQAAAPAAQQPAVYNNYYFSNDSFNPSGSNEQSYEQPEYEEVEAENCSYDQGQQYLEDDEMSYDQGNEWNWQDEQQQIDR